MKVQAQNIKWDTFGMSARAKMKLPKKIVLEIPQVPEAPIETYAKRVREKTCTTLVEMFGEAAGSDDFGRPLTFGWVQSVQVTVEK
jgi:hypothetical protein